MTSVDAYRRTVLKAVGAGAVGTAFVGNASAGESPAGNHHSYTWANDVLYDMLESEPHNNQDNEGDEEAHRPIWLVAPQDMSADGHSPHVNIPEGPLKGTDADHVIELEPGKKFYSAQWHVHAVFSSPGTLASDGVRGADLTSKDAIMAAANNNLVTIEPTPTVFTCPVRPHQHGGGGH